MSWLLIRSKKYAPYSLRSACLGSIREALQAGTAQASAAMTSSVAMAATKTVGSNGRVPKSIGSISLADPALATRPSSTPKRAGRSTSTSVARPEAEQHEEDSQRPNPQSPGAGEADL